MEQRILMVEDDAALGAMVSHLLSYEGFEVTVVGHGREALELLRTGKYDMAILDVMLPDIDGISIMRAIREDPVTASTVVVMLSAKTDDATTWDGWQAGCDYFMNKPFDPDVLASIIRRVQPKAAIASSIPEFAVEIVRTN